MSGPRVETPRLVLDQPPAGEAAGVVHYFARNRDHLEPWEPARPPGFYGERFWRERLAANRRETRDQRSLRLFLRLRDDPTRLVGCVNFSEVIRGCFLSCLLGYSLDGSLQGRGLMREALEAALPAAFERLELHRVSANYQPSNERSGRLLRRLGFVVEGYARDYLYIDGAWRDHVLTALVRPGVTP
ncbi:MAG: GNAT family N-acetyltransferase [Myxococcota bacterium]